MKGLPGNDDENKRRVEKFKVLRAASELLGRGGDSLVYKTGSTCHLDGKVLVRSMSL